jgi:putative restriction endonuclease
VLEEIDGPMLQHGLKECHEKRLLVLPVSRDLKPRRDFLEERYESFRRGW